MEKNCNLAALLWDESYLYGIWLYQALLKSRINFDLIKASELTKLEKYKILFVPGGWASNKIKALGSKGASYIRRFVKKGGIYFGICGGAGLVTSEELNLVNIKRKKQRVPAFSGKIKAKLYSHPLWQGINIPEFYLWWPSEFLLEETNNMKILAKFDKALKDSFSSDLPVRDFQNLWKEAEKLYEIFLNPERMKNTPLLIEITYEKGKIYLSLIHFDTPGDKNGLRVLKNIKNLFNLAPLKPRTFKNFSIFKKSPNYFLAKTIIRFLLKEMEEIMILGERNFLWFKRHPEIYQWKRGIRGSEYVNLWYMLKILKKNFIYFPFTDIPLKKLKEIKIDLKKFSKEAKKLLAKERLALQKDKIIFNFCEDEEINELRTFLFGKSKSYGGYYKTLIKKIDEVLFEVLKTKLILIKGLHSKEKE
ncbi:BPL-N domain-containing protein [Thermodesulfobacterium hydrogeniphilum]|uniref:BPL-N domain-containing protein n=1 Tax=Thermodesulfobacterium hydrogeniphilum TaxID=161156 RepID=UPI00056F1ED1|nr:BPL-N domain-containing protein [Thermodesulfobacterium hydrogeniphilum]